MPQKVHRTAIKQDPVLTQEMTTIIIELGADMVGVASIERFKNAPEGNRPTDYLPDARSVISIGMHIVDAVCDTWGEYTEPGKSIGPYLFYGYGVPNLELSRIANRAAKQLEHHGYEGLIFPPTWPIASYRSTGFGIPLLADFSHRHAAVAAGLGEFGWHSLVVTPHFGSRIRFNSIITNAPLVPSPMYDGPKICQPERCKYLCSRMCPAQAIPLDKTLEVEIGGKHFKYSRIESGRCGYGLAGLIKGTGCYDGIEKIPAELESDEEYVFDMKKRRNERSDRDKLIGDVCHGIITGNYCGRCFHQCPAHVYSRTGVTPK
jgi:epoxyqueuosine reductase